MTHWVWVTLAFLGLISGSQLPELLNIDWRRLEDNPIQGPLHQGFQDSDGGWIDDETVLTAFGYSAGGVGGFLNTSFTKNTSSAADWVQLPPAPVSGRQEVGSSIIDGAVYFVGGFSYTAPYTYRDVLRLGRAADGSWAWSMMPPLPYALCSMGVASIGSKLYVMGGADYDSTAFYTFSDRNGKEPGLGKRLWMLDIGNITAGWRRLPDMPGSPRFIHSFSPVGSKLLVLGGATANGSSVVDNWAFDVEASTWDPRLPDLPVSSGNFQTNGATSFMDRYIILVGGYQYNHVYHPNGTTSLPYGQAQRMCPPNATSAGCRTSCPASSSILDVHYMGKWNAEYDNDVFVYDSHTRTFGTAKATSSSEPELMPQGCGGLPINDNLPQTNVRGNKIFVIGGECNDRKIAGEHYSHYPTLALVGAISVSESYVV